MSITGEETDLSLQKISVMNKASMLEEYAMAICVYYIQIIPSNIHLFLLIGYGLIIY